MQRRDEVRVFRNGFHGNDATKACVKQESRTENSPNKFKYFDEVPAHKSRSRGALLLLFDHMGLAHRFAQLPPVYHATRVRDEVRVARNGFHGNDATKACIKQGSRTENNTNRFKCFDEVPTHRNRLFSYFLRML